MASNPFAYNMNASSSGGQSQSQSQSQSQLPGGDGLESYYLNQNPDAGFYNYLGSRGLTGTDPTAKFAQGQQNRYYNQYQAQAAQNPTQGFWDYLQAANPDIRSEFMAQSPQQRGDLSSRFLTPRGRWVTVG